MIRGVGIAKRGFGKALSRTGYSTGGEVMEDMSEIHEGAESVAEEARETKFEKEGYKETKAGKMVEAVKKGVEKVSKKMRDHYKENVKFVTPSPKLSKVKETPEPSDLKESEPSKKKFRKGGTVKKDTHITKDGRVAKKGLYYYMNRAKKLGKSKPGKGTVSDKALKASAKTAKK